MARIIPWPGVAAALVVPCDFHRGRLDAETIHKTWLRLERVEPLRGSRGVNRFDSGGHHGLSQLVVV